MISEILGLGTDIIEIERIQQSLEKYGEKFLDKLLTIKEKEYCYSFQNISERLSGTFAAKEAVVKALGCGFGEEASWHDVEILHSLNKKPEVTLSEQLNKKFHGPKFLLSISHCHLYAVATAIYWAPQKS